MESKITQVLVVQLWKGAVHMVKSLSSARFSAPTKFKLFIFPVVLMALLAFMAPRGLAQQLTGTLSGTVYDRSGAVVPGAEVVLKNQASGDVRTAMADSSGRFVITAIQPANYSVNITAKGFTTWQENDIVMNQGDTRDIPNIKLQIGNVSSQVEVIAGGAAVVPTDTAEISTSLSEKMITDFPLQGRDAGELMKIMLSTATAANQEDSTIESSVPTMAGRRLLLQRYSAKWHHGVHARRRESRRSGQLWYPDCQHQPGHGW
jgi:hypothetical protein